jgi:hypothetical protein
LLSSFCRTTYSFTLPDIQTSLSRHLAKRFLLCKILSSHLKCGLLYHPQPFPPWQVFSGE